MHTLLHGLLSWGEGLTIQALSRGSLSFWLGTLNPRTVVTP